MVRVCQVALAGLVAFGAWSIGFAGDDGPAAVLPETDEQFSLDLEVIDATDHGVVYVVEQRARPAYRIFSFDPATGADETVFTVPEDAIVFGIALDDDHSRLAVTYSPDFELDGSGLALLDLGSGELTVVSDVETDVYLTDPAWSDDGEFVLATRVDRRGDDEQLSVARIDATTGATEVVADDAINPVPTDGGFSALTVDEDGARRRIQETTGSTVREVAGGDLDLDHLVVGDDATLWVAALEPDESTIEGLRFGQPAAAHGSHDRPAAWWRLVTASDAPAVVGAEPTIIHDAAFGDDAIVAATNTGLAIVHVDDPDRRIDLIASRAIRLVAA